MPTTLPATDSDFGLVDGSRYRLTIVFKTLACLILAATISLASATPSAGIPTPRSLWIWDAPTEEMVSFATDRGISVLYLYTAPGFSSDDSYRHFVELSHAAGIQVSAAGGDPYWASDPALWTDWVDEVVGFGGFDGIVVDVEPHLHPDWKTDRRDILIRGFLKGLRMVSLHAEELPVYAATPFWWDNPNYEVLGQPLIEWVLDRTDGIIIMAYRDHAMQKDGILYHVAHEAVAATLMGKSFVIGLETSPTESDKVSFTEEGSAFMESEIGVIELKYGQSSSYGGIAVHDYSAYVQLRP